MNGIDKQCYPPELFGFSTRGKPIVVERRSARALRVTSATLVAIREGRAFYRLVGADGVCFATGPASDLASSEACAPTGSKASLPTGLASVALVTPDGRESIRVSVAQNVFAARAAPPAQVRRVVALDSTGQAVVTLSR